MKENWHSAQEAGSRKVVYFCTAGTLLLHSRVLLQRIIEKFMIYPTCPSHFKGIRLCHEIDIFFEGLLKLNQYFCTCTEGFKHFLIAFYRDI